MAQHFEISEAVNRGDRFACTVRSDVFSSAKQIYGMTSEDARRNAVLFASRFHAPRSTRVVAAGAAATALPGAVGAAAADGPLPFGEIVGAILVVSVVGLALFAASRLSKEDERACEEQYDRDIEICRRLSSRTCYEKAADRYASCLRSKPLPPLEF